MKTLSTNELTTYLKNAAELEASAFTQQQVLANAEKTLIAKEPVYRTVSRKHPDKPKEPVYKFGNEDLEKKAFRISIITSVVISAAGILCFFDQWKLSCFILLEGIIVVAFLLFRRRQIKKEISQIETENAQNRQAYEKAMEQYDHDLEHIEDVYKKEQDEAQQAYEEETARYLAAVDAVDQLRPALKNTQEILEKLYSLNVLSEKYRTLAAVSEIYEYFATGRVTGLEGSDGAYELYESELSQGLITDKMYYIISQLDDIKDHQSVLYNELKETKQIVTDIDGDVSRIIFAEPDAGDAVIIADYCSSIQGSNERALQYIEGMSS